MGFAAGSERAFSEQHAQRTAAAMTSTEASRLATHEAWRGITESHGRIGGRQVTSPGSADRLRDDIRRRLAAGTLPRAGGHAEIGQARGDRRCACCLEAIARPRPEYTVRDRIELHAHADCFALWVEESSGRATPGGWWASSDVAGHSARTSETARSAPARRGRAR